LPGQLTYFSFFKERAKTRQQNISKTIGAHAESTELNLTNMCLLRLSLEATKYIVFLRILNVCSANGENP